MSHLEHPNTVKVLLFGELEDGSLYIVMEYLEGRNLNQVVRKEGPLAPERAVPVLIQCCGALQEAHLQGIIHRDLKPENIFLSTNGGLRDYPKVLDFGLAKVTEREMRPGSLILTQEGMVFGTPEFMSPEQAQGKVLTAASDIYSLAVILYEVLTGKLPFESKSPMEYIQHHVTAKPISLSSRVPGKSFPKLLVDVMDRALAKKPEERFATAADFAAAMKAVLDGAKELPTSLALEAGPKAPAPAAAVVEAKKQTSRGSTDLEPINLPLKTNWGLVAGVAALCLILGAVGMVVFMKLAMPHWAELSSPGCQGVRVAKLFGVRPMMRLKSRAKCGWSA